MAHQEEMTFPMTRSLPPPANIEEVTMLIRQPGRQGGLWEWHITGNGMLDVRDMAGEHIGLVGMANKKVDDFENRNK